MHSNDVKTEKYLFSEFVLTVMTLHVIYMLLLCFFDYLRRFHKSCMYNVQCATGCPNKNATGFLLYCSGNTPPTRLRLYSFEN